MIRILLGFAFIYGIYLLLKVAYNRYYHKIENYHVKDAIYISKQKQEEIRKKKQDIFSQNKFDEYYFHIKNKIIEYANKGEFSLEEIFTTRRKPVKHYNILNKVLNKLSDEGFYVYLKI